MIKNVNKEEIFATKNLIDYSPGKVVNVSLAATPGVNVSVIAVDKGEGLSTHAAGGDAFVTILEGEVKITIDKADYFLKEGDSIVMPAKIPHALDGYERFKMLLVVVK